MVQIDERKAYPMFGWREMGRGDEKKGERWVVRVGRLDPSNLIQRNFQ